ncbi:MAG: pyridoxal phosphate-dependent aminotransferase [Granulosicoccaceae bacterium]
MKYSSLTQRVAPGDDPSAPDPWAVHELALIREANGEDIVFLSIGQEADEVTPAVIVDAAIESLQSGRHHYTQASGSDKLRNAVANYHKKLCGQTVGIDNCTVFAGAQNALFSVAQVLLETGDEVLMLEPYYTTYSTTFAATGAKIIEVPLTAANRYQLQVEQLLEAITNNTRLIVLNSPNNPMGQSYSMEQYQGIIDACVQHNIWLLIDTVYADIVDPELLSHPQTIPGADKILITVGSLSKSHRMTGWRMGWAVAPSELSDHLANLSVCMHYGLAPFIMDAAIVAIEQSTGTPTLVRDLLDKRRGVALKEMGDIAPAVIHDTGMGMFIIVDVEPLKLTALDFAMQLLEKHAVAVLPCVGFGPTGKYLVRIGLCVDDDKLATACKKIQDFVKTLT